jgi:hypothetical protein
MRIKPAKRAPAARRKPRTPTDNVKHVVKTWLPPGISEDEAKDPGTAAKKRARGKPA